jgi:hypothetical protein
VPEAPVEAALVILMVVERVAVETVLLPVEAAETEDLAEAVLLLVIVVIERTDWLADAADALDEAKAEVGVEVEVEAEVEVEVEAEAAEEMADRLLPLTAIWPE